MLMKMNLLFICLLSMLVCEVLLQDPCDDAVVINENKRSTAFVPGEFDVLLCDNGDQVVNGMYKISEHLNFAKHDLIGVICN